MYFLDYWAFQNQKLGPPLQSTVYQAVWSSKNWFSETKERTSPLHAGNKSQKTQMELVGAEAKAPPVPTCMGDMLALAEEGEWGRVNGELRWIDQRIPCVAPIW